MISDEPNSSQTAAEDDAVSQVPETEVKQKSDNNPLLYAIDETPPWCLSFLLGFQHYLTMFGATVGVPFVLSQAMCIADKPTIISELLSTLFFCSGIVTFLQSIFGVRLPIIQGGTYALITPAIAIMEQRNSIAACVPTSSPTNSSGFDGNITTGEDPEWIIRMRLVQGAIIVASLFQIVIGFSGIVGLVIHLIGPLTIAPTITLVALPLFDVAGYYCGSQWGVALTTMFFITLFSQVLKDVDLPLGSIKIPIFKLFPVLLALIIGWILSAILTVTNALPSDSAARTDYRSVVLKEASWFRVPYPGQWGLPMISAAAVFGMLAGILASMIESIGDYFACARLAGAPPPPKHALNRGIAFEGIGCLITGLVGTGNGTTSYSENIGAIGITRVGSVRVIQCGCVVMVVLSVIGKFGAVFTTIPNPVIGGILTIMFGMIIGVGLSALQYVDLTSMRNLFVLGVSLFFGLVIPNWTKNHQSAINLGNETINQIIIVLLSVSMFVGGLTGFILDLALPGTPEERGIKGWREIFESSDPSEKTRVASIHVYDPPFLTKKFMASMVAKYVPFLPYYKSEERETGVELS